MAEITRNRTIRPSTRLARSKSYKIDTVAVSGQDLLTVNITHEAKPWRASYQFAGADVAARKSISFRVDEAGKSILIRWSGATPL